MPPPSHWVAENYFGRKLTCGRRWFKTSMPAASNVLLSLSWARLEMARRPLSNSQITDGPTPDRTNKPVLVQPRNFRAALHCSGEMVISATRADRVGVSTGCIPQTSSPLFERAAGIAILLRAGSRLVLRVASHRVALRFAAAADDEADRLRLQGRAD
jgi:hypothetical protein